MTHEPRSTEEIYASMRSSLSGKIQKLSNFTDRSFNAIWTDATAQEVRELEVRSTVAELAGWIDYAGKEITEEDLDELGLETDVTPAEINEFMEERYLDELVSGLGITRLPGSRATGEVDISTQSGATSIPEGTIVTTEPDQDGNTLDFETTELAETAEGVTTVVDIGIRALEEGSEHNVPAGTIIRLAEPPLGVTGVINQESTTGGVNEESTEDLRTRAKSAVPSSSLGGTTEGIKGYLRQNVEGVGQGNVTIDESLSTCPSFVDVIVSGGTDSEVKTAIETSRPTGIKHNLIRPEVVQLGLDINLFGSGIDTVNVTNDIESFLLNLGIADNFYRDELIKTVMNADDAIINIDDLGGVIERVTKETYTYQTGTSEYRLDYTYEDTNGSISVTDESGDGYTGGGSDYRVEDQSGDGYPETLVWVGATPDDGEKFFVDYDVTVPGQTPESDKYDLDLVRDEQFVWNESETDDFTYDTTEDFYQLSYVPFDGTSSISDGTNTYTEGTEYEIVDNTGNGFAQTVDWSFGSGSPADNETFTVTYDQKLFQTKYEHRDNPNGIIRDDSGDVYNESTEYQLVDYDNDGEIDSIEWLTNPAGIASGDEFFFTYYTEGDKFFGNREKADPGTINVNVE